MRPFSARPLFVLISLVAAGALACGGSPAPALQSPTPAPAPSAEPPAAPPLAQAKPAPSPPATDASLIPREILFGNPEKAAPQISPDGKWIAYLAPVDGVLNVVVAPLSDPSKAAPATHDTSRPIDQFTWTREPNVLLYDQDTKGDENFHTYAVSLPGGAPKDLTPYANTRAELNPPSPKHPDEIVIGMNDRDPKYHDLYRVSLYGLESALKQAR